MQYLGLGDAPLIPALGRQRRVDLSEFEVSLVYRTSSGIVKQRNPVSKQINKKPKLKQKLYKNMRGNLNVLLYVQTVP